MEMEVEENEINCEESSVRGIGIRYEKDGERSGIERGLIRCGEMNCFSCVREEWHGFETIERGETWKIVWFVVN
jgi:hypothetical protein